MYSLHVFALQIKYAHSFNKTALHKNLLTIKLLHTFAFCEF